MFYLAEMEDYVRVEPRFFGLNTLDAVKQQLKETHLNHIGSESGKIIEIVDVLEVGEGIIIPGDGAAYYKSRFKLIVWKPELQELVYGTIEEITNFGAFMNLGALQGMIHISQTMEDFVNFSKSNTLLGRDSKKVLKKGDSCIARIVALSYKADEPKIGLTMRQPGLGKIEWIKEDKKKSEIRAKKAAKEDDKKEKAEKGGKKKK